jgi:DNA-binding MurR/RpiR family transcriptional regulator
MFRQRIQTHYENLTPSFRKLADFILEEQLDAAFMTATELANRMDVDAATVVRFAQTIGYSGFRELIKEVQQVVKAELTASYSPALDASDDAGLFRSVLENERHNLKLAQNRLTEQANAILPALLKAKRIWVMGQGLGAHLAGLCAAAFRDIGLPAVTIAPNPTEVASSLKGVGAEDFVIGFSITGIELGVADAIHFARERGAKTLAFGGSEVTAAALAAEMSIICPGPTQTHVPSFTGLAAAIVSLVVVFAARRPDKAAEMTANLQQSYRQLLNLQATSSAEVEVEELWRQF